MTIIARLSRIEKVNFGDCKLRTNASGVWEFRLNYGPGYRIYFGKHGRDVVVLLLGGDKGKQASDIKKAEKYWLDYKESIR